MFTDLRNGVILIALLEVLSHQQIRSYFSQNDCKTKFQEISNLSLCFDLMHREGVPIVNIAPPDIQEGNPKMTLGLIFTLLLFYQIDPVSSKGMAPPTVQSAESKLLAWVGSRLPPGTAAPTSFTLVDGKTICALVNSLQPGVITDVHDPLQNVQDALMTAESMFGVVKLLDAEDIVHNTTDPLSMMAYVSCLRDYALGMRPATVPSSTMGDAKTQPFVGAVSAPVAAPQSNNNNNQGVAICSACSSPVPVGNFCGVCGTPVKRDSGMSAAAPASVSIPAPSAPMPDFGSLPAPIPQPIPMPVTNPAWGGQAFPSFGAFPGGPNPYESYPESVRYSAPPPMSLPELIARYEIYNYQSNELALLRGYDLVFVCDDSGSMRTPLHSGRTRWDELKETVSLVVDIGRCFDDDGIDVYFLNRPPLKRVNSAADLHKGFIGPPAGFTPLTDTLTRVVAEQTGSKPLLILIATDGCPTTIEGDPDTFSFRRAVERCTSDPHRVIRIQFLACSDDENDVGWLNVLDREVRAVDVTADFETERAEVLRSGKVNRFSRGDWVCKALLGGISDYYDKLDE